MRYGPLIWIALALAGFVAFLVILVVGTLGISRLFQEDAKGSGPSPRAGSFITRTAFVCGMTLLFAAYLVAIGALSIVLIPS